MKQYYIIINTFWKEQCRDYQDMITRAYGYRLLGNKVEEIIQGESK
jgi:hypothetical protein